jgi:hypothetical protein
MINYTIDGSKICWNHTVKIGTFRVPEYPLRLRDALNDYTPIGIHSPSGITLAFDRLSLRRPRPSIEIDRGINYCVDTYHMHDPNNHAVWVYGTLEKVYDMKEWVVVFYEFKGD